MIEVTRTKILRPLPHVRSEKIPAYKKQVKQAELFAEEDRKRLKDEYGFCIFGWDVRANFDETSDIVHIVYINPNSGKGIWIERRLSANSSQIGFGSY